MEAAVFSSLPPEVDTLCSQDEIEAVRDLLLEHSAEWLTTARIAELLGWQKTRTAEKVRRVKGELLLLGLPVVESHAGYKVAASVEELDRCLEKEHARLRGLHRTIGALESCRATMARHEQPLARWG